MTKDNHKLGEFQLDGIPPMPRGVPQLEITYDVDANGIFTVSASENSTGKSQKLTIQTSGNNLSKEQIEKMVAESEKFKDEDEKFRNKVEAKNKLEGAVYGMKSSLGEDKLKEKIPEDEMPKLNEFVTETLKWMEDDTHTQEEYEAKLKELNDTFQPMKYMHQEGSVPPNVQMPEGMELPKDFKMPDMNNLGTPPTSGVKVEEVD
jgi:L1 cell adhesion molecule like protein